MGARMRFRAWRIDELDRAGFELTVPVSPVGPLRLFSWRGSVGIPLGGSAVVLPVRPVELSWPGARVSVDVGCYAQVPGGARLRSGAGLVIYTPSYVALSQVGGPVEPSGRLDYIDGCSDSLLICPARLGEPCLNLLHLPARIHQTEHTHPSDRIGIILRGSGACRTEAGEVPLGPGMFWYIPAEFAHSFHTEEESLDVLAWHPDSDFGPSHDWHPMINRTIVEGVAANDERHAAIRTAR
jgi:mannose-6-phosphate isomerase-like protein (cupin superfamily)